MQRKQKAGKCNWHFEACQMQPLERKSAERCLRDTVVFILGNSVIRQWFYQFAQLFGDDQGMLSTNIEEQKEACSKENIQAVCKFNAPSSHTHMQFCWHPRISTAAAIDGLRGHIYNGVGEVMVGAAGLQECMQRHSAKGPLVDRSAYKHEIFLAYYGIDLSIIAKMAGKTWDECCQPVLREATLQLKAIHNANPHMQIYVIMHAPPREDFPHFQGEFIKLLNEKQINLLEELGLIAEGDANRGRVRVIETYTIADSNRAAFSDQMHMAGVLTDTFLNQFIHLHCGAEEFWKGASASADAHAPVRSAAGGLGGGGMRRRDLACARSSLRVGT